MMLCPNDRCYGCGACAAVCPKNAISMRRDREGFFYPTLDEDRCVSCGLCSKACPANGCVTADYRKIYGFKHSDQQIRKQSSSGGAFSAIAQEVLEEGGAVYGAALTEDQRQAVHVRAENSGELQLLRGSKYVQSDTGGFSGVLEDLRSGKPVLYSGTACQIAGLYSYLKVKKAPTERLYTCDIICHGVASPLIYKEFIEFLQRKSRGKFQTYHFRDKSISWRGGSAAAYLKDGTVLKNDKLAASYMNVYYSGCCTRPSCYGCPFASTKRVSDLTIGDFWGIEKAAPDFEDTLGASVILVNTEKGQKLFSKLCGEVREDICISHLKQPNLHAPTRRPNDRDAFWDLHEKRGISGILHTYGAYGFRHTLRMYLSAIKRRIRK